MMTEQELMEIEQALSSTEESGYCEFCQEDQIGFNDDGIEAHEDEEATSYSIPHETDCPVTLAILLVEEVRRLQGELKEARGQAALLLELTKDNPRHVYMGACPDDSQPNKRDGRCPACKILVQAEKVVKGWDKKAGSNG